jgi:hypothetical protein
MFAILRLTQKMTLPFQQIYFATSMYLQITKIGRNLNKVRIIKENEYDYERINSNILCAQIFIVELVETFHE